MSSLNSAKKTGGWGVLLACGLGILALHLILFPPVQRLNFDFPAMGEIATEEIRAPFTYIAPLLKQDVEMDRLQRVVVEPPVLRILSPSGGVAVGGAPGVVV